MAATSPRAWLLLLGPVCPAIALVSDSAWSQAAGFARAWFPRPPRRLEASGGVGGLAIIVIGVRPALTGRRN
jgi:threonine/homoserine/homoserine lactone efflux protein